MAKRKEVFWHVVAEGWSGDAPGQAGILNVGRDIVIVLVDSEEPTGDEPVVPENDNFVVERVIGQWNLHGSEVIPQPLFVHERVYVTDVAPGEVNVRTLDSFRQADTSFLYHQVTPWDVLYDNDIWGNWQGASTVADRPVQNRMGGMFFRDIRVNRRINEGQALIYHIQLEGQAIPVDGTFSAHFWMRSLVRKA